MDFAPISLGIALKNLKALSHKDEFCNILTNKVISDNNYEHVFNVWKALKMNVMKDCYDFFLKVDFL